MVWENGHRLHNGKYIIEQKLGEGAFGVTYKAQTTGLKMAVVIKTPKPPNNLPLINKDKYSKYIEKFYREAELLARMPKHYHIVGVRDFFYEKFEEREIPCIVMEFIPGENLFALVKRQGELKEEHALKYIGQIGNALKTVHEKELVHRDAHPGNIIITEGKQAILIDFGLAKEIVLSSATSTHFAHHDFAPYEQFEGINDVRVDVYTLAASLYYDLTGKLPTPSSRRKNYKEDLKEPKAWNSSISDTVNKAILMGMELEAEDRPQSVQDWLDLLHMPKSNSSLSESDSLYKKGSEEATGSIKLLRKVCNRLRNFVVADKGKAYPFIIALIITSLGITQEAKKFISYQLNNILPSSNSTPSKICPRQAEIPINCTLDAANDYGIEIRISKGDKLRINARGRINTNPSGTVPDCDLWTDPNGLSNCHYVRKEAVRLHNLPFMALVGQFNREKHVLIGDYKEQVFESDGYLRLFVNDWEYRGNQGTLTITVRRQP
ncbi:MAG TPA: hypothetical protein DCE56_37340 [Cyanobacteria bacterium UBA8553]|nr:hypothetical protein [Cyanobacteria bacterium UBA8553]